MDKQEMIKSLKNNEIIPDFRCSKEDLESLIYDENLKEFELCVTDEISASKIVPPNNIIFYGDSSKEILKLCGNGDIYVNGRLTKNDIEVVEGLRHFLRNNKYAI